MHKNGDFQRHQIYFENKSHNEKFLPSTPRAPGANGWPALDLEMTTCAGEGGYGVPDLQEWLAWRSAAPHGDVIRGVGPCILNSSLAAGRNVSVFELKTAALEPMYSERERASWSADYQRSRSSLCTVSERGTGEDWQVESRTEHAREKSYVKKIKVDIDTHAWDKGTANA